MCVPVDDPVNAARLGWEDVDVGRRLRLVADVCSLGGEERSGLVALIDAAFVRGSLFLRRRVAAGDPGFVQMWNAMGGERRFDRRREWWADARPVVEQRMR